MVSTSKAVVVGAGIGGLAAAVALRRIGWQVEVFERATELGEVGAAVSIAPNAVKALRELGLEAAFQAAACELDGLESRTKAGRRITGVDAGLLKDRYGAGLYNLHRAALHELLREAAGIIHTGHTATAVTSNATSASVDFDGPRGPVTVDADLVVAADGVRSRLRAGLFGTHPGPAYAGYTVWRGLVSAEAAGRIGVPARLSETWGRGARFGHAPIGDGRATGTPSRTPNPAPSTSTTQPPWSNGSPTGTIPSRACSRPLRRRRCCAATSTTWPSRSIRSPRAAWRCSGTPPTR